MKPKETDLKEDVGQLLKDSVLAQATAQVEQKFEQAWQQLDPTSRELLGAYFDGTPVAVLSRERGLDEAATEEWIQRTKRQLVQLLRSQSPVRQ